jgi:hypothetical protein
MVVSAVGYFFIITVFTAVMTFMALLIGLFSYSTFEKVRHYLHPRPITELSARTVTLTNSEPQHLQASLETHRKSRR